MIHNTFYILYHKNINNLFEHRKDNIENHILYYVRKFM